MKTKKRTPKAVALLTKVETLLSDVLDECFEFEKSVEKNVRVLLRSAEASVDAAKEYFIAPQPGKAARKIAKRAAHVSRHRVAGNRRRAPLAARKRSIRRVARKAA